MSRDDYYDRDYERQRRQYGIDPRKVERSQAQICGCGNPHCTQCNPEVVAERFVRGIGLAGNPARSGYATSIVEEVLRDMSGIGSFSEASSSYNTARKAVAKHICDAPEQSFDDIVGNNEALEQLRDAIEAPVKHKALYEAYSMKMPKGAMLSGPPGCGKTMFARAAAAELKRLYGKSSEFISISGGELQTKFVGETEAKIKAIFTFAREFKHRHGHPLLVFIDEAEVILPDRTGRVRRVAPWEESQVATFLAEMDGMQESGAFVLLATNRPEVIDQAVLRDGRCDFKILVKKPTQEAIEGILKKNFAGIFAADPVEDLVFAAIESLYDPHKVILHEVKVSGRIKINEAEHSVDTSDLRTTVTDTFRLEHILSGAMAAAIPNRAKRHAFARDKQSGTATGVTVSDVVSAVNGLFEENKDLDHQFALENFLKEKTA